jgi:hypothetical protein
LQSPEVSSLDRCLEDRLAFHADGAALLVEDDVGASIGESTDGEELGEVGDVEDVAECDGVLNALDGAPDSERSLADRVDDLVIGYLDLRGVGFVVYEL